MNYIDCHINRCRDLRRHRNCIFDIYTPYHEFEIPFNVKLASRHADVNIPIPNYISQMMDAYEFSENIPLLIGLEKFRLVSAQSLKDALPLYAKCRFTSDNFLYPWRDGSMQEAPTECKGIILGELMETEDENTLKLENVMRLKTRRSVIGLNLMDRRDNFHKIVLRLDRLNEDNTFTPLDYNGDISGRGSVLILIPKCL